jgi:HK97 family phage major capsid protein
MSGKKELRASLKARAARMEKILATARDRKLTRDESDEFDQNEREAKALEAKLAGLSAIDTRAEKSKKNDRIEGRPKEILSRGQSMQTWVKRAAENGLRMEGDRPIRAHDREQLNDYWGARMGLRSETRALGEDTAGSGQAITPQSWTAQFIDFLYPATLVGRAGASMLALQTEIVNVPQLTGAVQPAWLAENASSSIDATPAFSTLQFNSKGAFYDITVYSRQLAEDAYVQGGLPDLLAASAARNYAVGIDQAALYGVSGNSGNPGLNNETGLQFRKYAAHSGTTGSAPVDTTDMSVMAELVRNKNVEPSGYLTSPQVYGTVNRTNASTVAKFWDMPADVSKIPWYFSTTIPVTETDTALGTNPAQTGGAFSSIYCGDWSRMIIGMHVDLQTTVLTERFADQLQIGLLTYMRYSIRTSHPEAFCRDYGIITT